MSFLNDLTGFNTAAANPAVVVDFDSIAANTDITGQTMQGVTFLASAAPLIVVRGSDTFSTGGFGPGGTSNNRLFPTSGENCISPGGVALGPGPNPPVEGDSIRLVFSAPVTAVGFDVLVQAINGDLFPVRVYDTANSLIFSETVAAPNISNTTGGTHFYGVVSSERNIARIEFDENDSDNQNPDSNIGYDALRIQACPPGIECPTISAWGLTAMFLLTLTAGTVVLRRRAHAQPRFG